MFSRVSLKTLFCNLKTVPMLSLLFHYSRDECNNIIFVCTIYIRISNNKSQVAKKRPRKCNSKKSQIVISDETLQKITTSTS